MFCQEAFPCLLTNKASSIDPSEQTRLLVQDLKKEDVPLPKLGPKLHLLLKEVQFGRGFQLIRCAIALYVSCQNSNKLLSI